MYDSGSQQMPHRIQRRRTKGWRMPDNTIYVGRGSKYGNPHTVAECGSHEEAVVRFIRDFTSDPLRLVRAGQLSLELRGRNLACWCPLDKPCHADVLLDIANS